MSKLKPQICPECGNKYIRFDLHWINCPKNDSKLDVLNPPAQKLGKSATSNISNELDEPVVIDILVTDKGFGSVQQNKQNVLVGISNVRVVKPGVIMCRVTLKDLNQGGEADE